MISSPNFLIWYVDIGGRSGWKFWRFFSKFVCHWKLLNPERWKMMVENIPTRNQSKTAAADIFNNYFWWRRRLSRSVNAYWQNLLFPLFYLNMSLQVFLPWSDMFYHFPNQKIFNAYWVNERYLNNLPQSLRARYTIKNMSGRVYFAFGIYISINRYR
jgi:hypothetical protein